MYKVKRVADLRAHALLVISGIVSIPKPKAHNESSAHLRTDEPLARAITLSRMFFFEKDTSGENAPEKSPLTFSGDANTSKKKIEDIRVSRKCIPVCIKTTFFRRKKASPSPSLYKNS